MAIHDRSRGAVRAVSNNLPDDEKTERVETSIDVVNGETGTPVADPESEGGVTDVVVE